MADNDHGRGGHDPQRARQVARDAGERGLTAQGRPGSGAPARDQARRRPAR